MKKTMTTLLAAALFVIALAPAAMAQTETTEPADRLDQLADELGRSLERIKAAADEAIEQRLETLDRLTAQVESSDHITAAHAELLLADYRAAASGLTALGVEIDATTEVGDALNLTAKIASDYRIYLVVVPKSVEVGVSDTVVAAVARIEESGVAVQAAIDAMAAAGVDVSEAQRLLDSALGDAAEAKALAGPVADRVIGLDASDWQEPADSTLQAGRADLEAAGDELRASVRGIRDAVRALFQR